MPCEKNQKMDEKEKAGRCNKAHLCSPKQALMPNRPVIKILEIFMTKRSLGPIYTPRPSVFPL